MLLRDLEEWPHWPGIFKTVTMLAGLFEPFVFPPELLWLGRGLGIPSTVLLTGYRY